MVDAVTPALSRHGLSASWKLTRDEKDWLEVTCTLKHVGGHAESVSMGGPPDAGGAKNAIQARASAKTYLERYTLKAICGVAEGGDDTDGAPIPPQAPMELVGELVQNYVDTGCDTKAMRQIVSFVISVLEERALAARLTRADCVSIGDCELTLDE